MPTPVDSSMEAFATFIRYRDGHDDIASASLRATEDLKECARSVSALGNAFGAFDLLDHLRFTQTFKIPDAYVESCHQGSVPTLELAAMALIARPSTEFDTDRSAMASTPNEAVQQVHDLGAEMLRLVLTRMFLHTVEDGGSYDALARSVVYRELLVRSSTYEHIAERTLDLLLGTELIEEACRASLGFTAREALDLFRALNRRSNDAAHEYLIRLERWREFAGSRLGHSADGPHVPADGGPPPAPVAAVIGNAWDHVWFPIPVESTFCPADLVSATGLSSETVDAFLSVFEYRPDEVDPGELILDAVSGPSPLRTRPILRDHENRRFLVHSGFGVYAIREAIEERLKGTEAWSVYDKHRAGYLEQDALHLISRMLPTARALSGIEYLGPNQDKNEIGGGPEGYTSAFEADGLVVVDDVAIIVEAKAGAVRPRARSGDADTLRQDLHKLVTKASDQARRLHDLILKDRGIRLRDRSWLDLSMVREVHSVVVSLEDLSGLATVPSELIERDLLSADHVPWLVSIYDLHIVSDLIQHPAELVLFLRRRTHPVIVSSFASGDEMDYFMRFLGGGLHPEDEADPSESNIPAFIDLANAQREHSDSEAAKRLWSHTDPLDAWYLYKHGGRREPAQRPELKTEPGIRTIINALSDCQAPGWLSISTALLSQELTDQRFTVDRLTEALNRTRTDSENHTACVVVGEAASETATLIFSTVVDIDKADAEMDHLDGYVTAMKHQMQTAIGAGLMFDTNEPLVPKRICCDSRAPGLSDEIDRQVEEYNLTTPDETGK